MLVQPPVSNGKTLSYYVGTTIYKWCSMDPGTHSVQSSWFQVNILAHVFTAEKKYIYISIYIH